MGSILCATLQEEFYGIKMRKVARRPDSNNAGAYQKWNQVRELILTLSEF